MGHLLLTVKRVAQQAGLNNGYRVVINTVMVGQTVNHLHLHIFGGRQMTWPQADSKANPETKENVTYQEIYKSK